MSQNETNLKLLKPKIDIVFQSLFSKKNEKITKAFAEAMLDEKAIMRKGYEDGKKAGLAAGRAEGRTEGKIEERKLILNNLRKMKLTTEDIGKILNITEEKLKKME